MRNTAQALGQDGLRLRSRRVRADTTHGRSVQAAFALVVFVSLIGLASANVLNDDLRLPTISVPGWTPGLSGPTTSSAPTTSRLSDPERERYLAGLAAIHGRLQRDVLRIGQSVAVYAAHEIDRAELRVQLDEGLWGYRQIENDVRALRPLPDLQDTQDRYLTAVHLLQESTLEMLKTCDDGNSDHLLSAVPMNLEVIARLRALSDRLWSAA